MTANGRYRIGSLNVTTFYPSSVTTTLSDDRDGGGNRIGTLMQLDFASSTSAIELITVFSETLTAASYSNGVLTLSDGSRVTFANGTITVQPGGARHRAVRP
jgi:hypothetical protein